MATFSRNVTVNWEGSLMEGKGEAKAGSGAFSLPVSFARRIGEAQGQTSPEELIAAAHASCYAMALLGDRTAATAAARNNVWLAYPMHPAPGQQWVLFAWVGLGLLGAIVQLGVTARGK